MPVGASVTLRGARMYEFLDRFITLAVPRVRDFRGLPNKSFDGRGNYTTGIKEQLIFPEIDYDKVEKIHGMDITVVTTAGRDDLAMALLREFGWPFRGETPVRGGVKTRHPAGCHLERRWQRPVGLNEPSARRSSRCAPSAAVSGAGGPGQSCGEFGLCRICFRELALKGEIPGVRKASW